MLSLESRDALARLGARVRQARLDRNESQARFAARVGVSIPTLRHLEAGDPAVSLGLLAEALWVLKQLDELDRLLAPPKDLFARWETEEHGQPSRKRASRPRKPK
jgi:transcriptional regulator with XRE-family HTH domain